MNRNDKFVGTSGTTILFIASIAVYTYPEFFIATAISTIVGCVFIIISFLLFIVYDKEVIAIKKEETERIKKEKAKKIREQEKKIKLEQEEKNAYKKNRPSRTAKAAQMLDVMESSKRRM